MLFICTPARQAGRLTTTSLLKGAAITNVTHLITKQEYKYRNGHYLLAKFPSTGFNEVQWVLWQSPTVHILLQDCQQQHCKWLAMPAMCSSFPTSKLTKQERYLSSFSYQMWCTSEINFLLTSKFRSSFSIIYFSFLKFQIKSMIIDSTWIAIAVQWGLGQIAVECEKCMHT